MASNAPNTGAPLSPAEIKGMLAMFAQDVNTNMAETRKLSVKLEEGLVQQKCSEHMLEHRLELSDEDLRVNAEFSEARITMLERRLDASNDKIVILGGKIGQTEDDLSNACLKLLGKIGQLEGWISGMQEARHVEQHERSSNATGDVVVKVCSPLSLSLSLFSVIQRHCDDNAEQPYFISAPRDPEGL